MKAKRWKAVATYRQSHDQRIVKTEYFEEIVSIDDWIEQGPDWRSLDTLVVTYALSDERLTLADILAEETERLAKFHGTQIDQ